MSTQRDTQSVGNPAEHPISGPVLPRSVVEHGTAVPVAQLVSSTSALT